MQLLDLKDVNSKIESLICAIENKITFFGDSIEAAGSWAQQWNDEKTRLSDDNKLMECLSEFLDAFLFFWSKLREYGCSENEIHFVGTEVAQLQKKDFHFRLYFYIFLKATLRYKGAYARKSIEFNEALLIVLKRTNRRFCLFIEFREELEGSDAVSGPTYKVYGQRYSQKVCSKVFEAGYFSGLDRRKNISVLDARSDSGEKVDAIICDPPYGFNTNEDIEDLSRLYVEFFDVAVRKIKNNGHFIICLPAESYTGRKPSYCTNPELVSQTIAYKAKKHGKVIYAPEKVVSGFSLEQPYYWKAEKALKRTILHFRIRDLALE